MTPILALLTLLLWTFICLVWGGKLAIEDKGELARKSFYTLVRGLEENILMVVTAIGLLFIILFL